MRIRRLIASLFVGLLCMPAGASAASQKLPKAGKHTLVGLTGPGIGGGFRVARDRKSVSGFSLAIAGGQCGSVTSIRISGKLKLSRATRGGVTIPIVGRNAPSTSDGVAQIPVKATANGSAVSGQLKLLFGGISNGEFTVDSCDVFFRF